MVDETNTPEKNSEKLENAHLTLKRVVASPEIEVMVGERGPLTLDQLSPRIRTSEAMQAVLRAYGWPSYREDSGLTPVTTYSTDLNFLQSLRPVREGDHSHVASSTFFQMLRISPCELPIDRQEVLSGPGGAFTMFKIYPFLHRAYAAEPELFDNLRIVLDDIHDKHRKIADDDHIYDFLTKPDNAYILAAIHDAYRIMGRLFKRDDPMFIQQTYGAIGLSRSGAMAAPAPIPEDVLRFGDVGQM